jgi:hypothetical protein
MNESRILTPIAQGYNAMPPNLEAERMPHTWFAPQQRQYTIEHGFMPRREFILPPFQRGAVWTLEQDTAFIESVWMGLPIGNYCHNRAPGSPFDGWLLDGQQRWTALRRYVNGVFPVHGRHFSELHTQDRNYFMFQPFTCLETSITDEDLLREVFERLAYGGTPNVRE